jgi:hypothetical protein
MTIVIVWLVCIAALAVTALLQVQSRRTQRIRAYDVFDLIPFWTFFAPRTLSSDARVLWRERRIDGTLSSWRELIPLERPRFSAVWHPTRRRARVINGPEVGWTLRSMALLEPGDNTILVTSWYLLVLNMVLALPASPLTGARQFIIVTTTEEEDDARNLRPGFLSQWHPTTPSA